MGLVLLALAASAQASIVSFTDTGMLDLTGVTLNNGAPVGGYAIDITDATYYPASTIRGVTFSQLWVNATVPGVTSSGGNWNFWADAAPVTGTDAAAMRNFLMVGYFSNMSLTFDVAQGQAYKLQMIGSVYGWPDTNFDVDISSTAGLDGDNLAVAGGGNYLYTQEFTTDANTVTIDITHGGSGFDYPYVSGLLLTPVPEPATMSLLAIGGLSALIRRRK